MINLEVGDLIVRNGHGGRYRERVIAVRNKGQYTDFLSVAQNSSVVMDEQEYIKRCTESGLMWEPYNASLKVIKKH